jgi:hypothetical protein
MKKKRSFVDQQINGRQTFQWTTEVVPSSDNKDQIYYIPCKRQNSKHAGSQFIFDDNDNDINIDPSKITILEREHSNNPNSSLRTYKLLGINFDENMNLNVHISLLL